MNYTALAVKTPVGNRYPILEGRFKNVEKDENREEREQHPFVTCRAVLRQIQGIVKSVHRNRLFVSS